MNNQMITYLNHNTIIITCDLPKPKWHSKCYVVFLSLFFDAKRNIISKNQIFKTPENYCLRIFHLTSIYN